MITEVQIDDQNKVDKQPDAVWWVKVRNKKGQVGWSRLPDNFDNKGQLRVIAENT